MKLKRTVLLAAIVVTMGLLLGANAAQAANVKFGDPNNPNQATRIENFDIDSKRYTVVFTDKETVAADIYGAFPGTFDFDFDQSKDAADAVNEELSAAGAQTVGAAGEVDSTAYRIGFESDEVGPSGQKIEAVFYWDSTKQKPEAAWQRLPASSVGSYNTGNWIWAVFTLEGPAPPPVTIGGTVSGLEGSGLVLRNRGDDETIDINGPFEFHTPMTPDDWYNVTVATNPSNPAQTCSVENGSGKVPEQAVTDVEVTCDEPVLGDVIKVAAAGDTIGDTTLSDISEEAGVAINLYGLVAFGALDISPTIAVFTQDVKVVAQGDTIGDTVLKTIHMDSGVAINHEGLVAFHGDAFNPDAPHDSFAAVFTQDRVIVREGDTVPGGTVYEIYEWGNVAINNNLNKVAFHGRVEIEEGPKARRAVFTATDGQDTQVVAQVGSTLPDETTVAYIYESGSVAINDFDVVAFHGAVDDPVIPENLLKAVFTTDGKVAVVGDILEDGTTLNAINDTGGVAINLLGDVAFHGSGVQNDHSVDAVFTQYGVVAKVGDLLPDGTLIDEINDAGGVAINIFGDVVFQGRTGRVKAVFTQYGVVAKVGDNLADGTTLKEINDSAGWTRSVAINPYGTEVAFQGQFDDQEGTPVNAVFVGQAP
jgi:hypothetical protein